MNETEKKPDSMTPAQDAVIADEAPAAGLDPMLLGQLCGQPGDPGGGSLGLGRQVAQPRAVGFGNDQQVDRRLREDVFEGARQHMMDAWPAIGGRRAFKKDILWSAFPLAHAPVEDILFPPELQDLLFHLRVVDGRFYFFKLFGLCHHFTCLICNAALGGFRFYNRMFIHSIS